MRILAGDIGGTKTWLALYDNGAQSAETHVASAKYQSLEAAIEEFLGDRQVDAAAFGIAGPVRGEVVQTTNLPWTVDAARLRELLGTTKVRLLNDFHAAALGIDALGPDDRFTLQAGAIDPTGPSVLIGAGTGLGKAVRIPGDGEPRVLTSEGGHANFAPSDGLDDALLTWLRTRHVHVSVERVVSGMGLPEIFRFLVESARATTELREEVDGAAVSAAAQRGDPAATMALERFVHLYGAEAGNFALNVLPTGGLFVGGGIAPKLHQTMGPRFSELFMRGMLAKGPMAPLLQTMRVELILQPKVGLLGAHLAAVQ